MEKAQGHRMRTGRARAVATRARLVAQAERGGRVRVVRGQGRREAELEQHAPLAHEERVGELRRWDGGTVRGAVCASCVARCVVRFKGCAFADARARGRVRQRGEGRRGPRLPAVQPHHRGRACEERARGLERRRAAVEGDELDAARRRRAQRCEHCSLVLLRVK